MKDTFIPTVRSDHGRSASHPPRCVWKTIFWLYLLLASVLLFPPTWARGQGYDTGRLVHERGEASMRLASLEKLPAFSQTFSLHLDDVTLEQALQRIAARAGFNIVYAGYDVLTEERVTLHSGEARTVREALQVVLRGTDLALVHSPSGRFVVVRRPPEHKLQVAAPDLAKLPIRLPVKVESIRAQLGTIAGTVIDSTTGEALPGVNVVIAGTQRGASTDAEGRFVIADLDPGTYGLLASFVGYATKRVEGITVMADDTTHVDIALSRTQVGLDEVVVVGYGTQQRRDLTGSISSVSDEEIGRMPIASVGQALQGRVAGARVITSSSEPGGGIRIRIRGAGSINANNAPLYVIDGLPIDGSGLPGMRGARSDASARNPLNWLNPADIESIEILKDASATAIYGARGANGVILITTKKGTAGGLRVNYGVYAGMQRVAQTIDVLTAQEYMRVRNGLREARGEPAKYTPEEMAAVGEGTDWQDVIFDPAPIMNHLLSFSGGNENTRYYTSLGYFDQEGIVKGSGIERYTVRLNLDHDTGGRFQFGINMNASFTKDEYASVSIGTNANAGPIFSALYVQPTLPVYDENGNYANPQNDIDNPLALIEGIADNAKTNHIFGSAFAEYEVLDGLTTRLNVGSDRTMGERRVYESRATIHGSAADGIATVTSSEQSTNLAELTLTYDTYIGDRHHLTLLGGATYQVFNQSFTRAVAEGFPSDVTEAYNLALGENYQRPSSQRSKHQLLSYLSRLNYEFADKYLITASFRVDGSSRFGENNKFGYFPSLALGWQIAEESFMQGLGWLDNLKLRTSYGVTGNQAIGNYNSLALLSRGATAVLGEAPVIGTAPSRVPNADLKWERTTQYNAGLDFGVFQNRISGSIDYFIKNTNDLLLSFPIPRSTGYNVVVRNAGSVRNRGLEATLHTINSEGAIEWSSNLSFSAIRNEVTDLHGTPEVITGGFSFVPDFAIIREGEPIAAYYGFVVEGIVQKGETVPAQPNAKPGDLKVRDSNSDGQITAEDRAILGSPFPDYTLGLGNTISVGNVSLSLFIQAVQGQELFNANWLLSDVPINRERNRLAEPYLKRWAPGNPTNEHPSFTDPTSYAGTGANSRAVEDASYIRLQNVKLTYSLPVRELVYLRNASIYVSAQNLFTITDYRGYNPDVSARGGSNVLADFNAYPLARTFTVGLNIGL